MLQRAINSKSMNDSYREELRLLYVAMTRARNKLFMVGTCRKAEELDTYQLRPSYDFIQELLWNGADIEVLEPQSLRQEIANIVEQLHKKYKR